MISGYVERAGKRCSYEAPIMWADFNTEKYYRGRTCNCSHGGMCFETDCAAKTKTIIRIKTVNYLPSTDGPEAYKFYEAKVKWCIDLPVIDTPRYGVGVQYLVKSHNIEGPDYPCSLCGAIISCGNINCVREFVYLCPPCFNHYQSLPDGMIKESIMDILIGNVI
jgi:hypothetical protein